MIQNKEDLVAGNAPGTADRIQIWNGTEFTSYFYRAKKTNNPGKFTIGPCWVEANTASVKAETLVTRNTGVWFARPDTAPETATITISGQINGGNGNIQINPGFNMIGSAFPVDIAVNDESCPIDWANCAVAGNAPGTSDRIQIWNGTEFTSYFYRAKKTNNPGKFTIGPCWVEANTASVKADLTIPAGTGFWYARPDASAEGVLPQISPLAK